MSYCKNDLTKRTFNIQLGVQMVDLWIFESTVCKFGQLVTDKSINNN